MHELFQTIIYKPLYNGFIFLLNNIPGADIGIAIIILTVLVRFLLLPLTHKAVASQAKIKAIEPKVREIKEKHGKDKQEQARRIMELYQKHNINPFSSCMSMIIQIPVVLGLFFIFYRGLQGLHLDPTILYGFNHLPESLGTSFLGLIDITKPDILFAVIAGIAQYFQLKLSVPPPPPRNTTKKEISFKDELGRSMGSQMKYTLPLVIFAVAMTMPASVSLYWATSNLFSVGHELYVKNKANKIEEGKE